MRLLLREVAGLAPSAVVCLSRGMMIGITDIRSDLESVFRSGDQYCFVRKQRGNTVLETQLLLLRSETQWFTTAFGKRSSSATFGNAVVFCPYSCRNRGS